MNTFYGGTTNFSNVGWYFDKIYENEAAMYNGVNDKILTGRMVLTKDKGLIWMRNGDSITDSPEIGKTGGYTLIGNSKTATTLTVDDNGVLRYDYITSYYVFLPSLAIKTWDEGGNSFLNLTSLDEFTVNNQGNGAIRFSYKWGAAPTQDSDRVQFIDLPVGKTDLLNIICPEPLSTNSLSHLYIWKSNAAASSLLTVSIKYRDNRM